MLDDLAETYGDLFIGPATASTQLLLDSSNLIISSTAVNLYSYFTDFEKRKKLS